MTTAIQLMNDRCHHCRKALPEKGWCCESAELVALRAIVDQTVQELGSEVTAPLGLDDGGIARTLLTRARSRLSAIRSR